MSEPSVCAACGSDRVEVIDSRRMPAEAIYRRRACRDCGARYSSTSRTFQTNDGVNVTLETVSDRRHPSALRLERAWQRIRASLSFRHKF